MRAARCLNRHYGFSRRIHSSMHISATRIRIWGKDDKEYARQQSEEYYRSIEPLRRERDAVAKVMADFYGLSAMPVMFVDQQQTHTSKQEG